MATTDTCCSLAPYFKIHPGKLDDFKALTERFVDQTRSEPACLYYAFSFNGDEAHCREGYADAAGLLAHLENVQATLQAALQISDLTRLEVHAPASELAKLREPLGPLNAAFFELAPGFRN